jgi:hypothetical protein
MEKHFLKVQSQYLFYEDFTNAKGDEETVAVRLTIDHKIQTFSIYPERMANDKFAFIAGDKNTSSMWYAINRAICNANSFARKELSFE